MEQPNRHEVENDLVAALEAFEGHFPDKGEREAAMLMLCRRLALIVSTKAHDVAQGHREQEWRSVLYALDRLSPCELCGGTGLCIARVESTERGSLPGLGVPCPACVK